MKIKIKSLRSEAVDPKAVSNFFGPRLAAAAKKVSAKYPELDPGDEPDELGLSGKLSDAEKKVNPEPAPGMSNIPAGGAEVDPTARPAIPVGERPQRIAGPATQRAAAQDTQNIRKGKDTNTAEQDWKKIEPLIDQAIASPRYKDANAEELKKRFKDNFDYIYKHDFRKEHPATINDIFRGLPTEARQAVYDMVIRKPASASGDPKKSGLLGTAAKEFGANVKAAVGFTKPERDFGPGSAISRQRGETESKLESDVLQPIENQYVQDFKSARVESLLDLKNRIEAVTKVGGGAKSTASSPEFDNAIKNFIVQYDNLKEKHKAGIIKTDAANAYIEGMKNILMFYKQGKLTNFSESRKYDKQVLNELFTLRNRAIDKLLASLKPLDKEDYNYLNGGPEAAAPTESPKEEPKGEEKPEEKPQEKPEEKGTLSDDDLLKIALENRPNAQKRFDVFKQNMDSIIGNLDEIIDSMFQKVSPRKKYDYYSSSDVKKPVDSKDSQGNYDNFESPLFETNLKLVVKEGKIHINEIRAIDPLSALKVFKFKLREKLKKVVSTIKLEDFIKAYIKVAKTQFKLTLGDEKNRSKLKKALTSFRLFEADEREDAKPLQAGARLKGITALKDTEYRLLDLVLRIQNPKMGLVDYVIETFKDPTVNLTKVYSPEQLTQIQTYIKSAFKVVSAGDTFSSKTTDAGGKEIKGTAKITPADQKTLASKLVGGENDELKGKGKEKIKGNKPSAGAIGGASPFGIKPRTVGTVGTAGATGTAGTAGATGTAGTAGATGTAGTAGVTDVTEPTRSEPAAAANAETTSENPEIKKILSLFGEKAVPVKELNQELAQKLATEFIKFLEDKKSNSLTEAMRLRFMQLSGLMDEARGTGGKFTSTSYGPEIEKFLKNFETSSSVTFTSSTFKKIKSALMSFIKESSYANLFDTSSAVDSDGEDKDKLEKPSDADEQPEKVDSTTSGTERAVEPETAVADQEVGTQIAKDDVEAADDKAKQPEDVEVDETTIVGKLVAKARSAGISKANVSNEILKYIFEQFISFFNEKKKTSLNENILFEGLRMRLMHLAGILNEDLEEGKQSQENKLVKEFFDNILSKLSKQSDEKSKNMLGKIKEIIGSSRTNASLRKVMVDHMNSDGEWKSKTAEVQPSGEKTSGAEVSTTDKGPESSIANDKGTKPEPVDTGAATEEDEEDDADEQKRFIDMLKSML